MLDLFGDEIKPKLSNGYAGDPGRGPEGETCGSCAHLLSHRGKYFKCSLADWTFGPATDIRKRTAACQYWQLDGQTIESSDRASQGS